MMNDLETSVSSKICLIITALLLLSWKPAFLQSETLTMSTYYPAPYAGYDKLLTTGNTYLAKSEGSYVQWGGGKSRLTSDQGGAIDLVASSASAKPYIRFTSGSTSSYDIRLTITHLCKNPAAATCSFADSEAVLSVKGDFMLQQGVLRKICKLTSYSKQSNSTNPSLFSYCGGSPGASQKYTVLGTQEMIYFNGSLSIPESGKMLCCKFETIS